MKPILVTLALAAVAGCGPESKPPPATPRAIAPSATAKRLFEQHRALQQELRDGAAKLLEASAAYGRARGKYLTAVLAELGVVKAPTTLIRSVTEMADERDRIAADLQRTLQALGDALGARAAAEERFLAAEIGLWDLEVEAYGSHAAAAQRAGDEIKLLRDAETSLHVAQKAQQMTYTELGAREFEAVVAAGEDPHVRDRFDTQLTQLREDLAAKMDRLIAAARAYDEASDKIHRKLLGGFAQLQSADAPSLQERGRVGLDQRDRTAAEIARARAALKAAMVARAEERLREIDHDAEIAAVLERSLKPAVHDAVVAKVRPARDAASELRMAMHAQEQSLAEVRKKIVKVEADITALGY